MWRYNYTDELYHHGVPGMKWGVRRYQNKSGSLTAAGRKRINKIKNKLAAKKQKEQEDKNVNKGATKTNIKKSVREMSDADLKSRLNRLQNEQQVIRLENERASAGKRFVSTVGKDVIKPALIDSGKRLVTDLIVKAGKDQLDLDGKDKNSDLKREVQGLELQQRKIKAEKWLEENRNLKSHKK